MRTISVILFSAFYLMISTGFSVNVHYCGGKIASVKLFVENGKSCCCGSTENMPGCCDDETFYFQMENDQQINQSFRLAFDRYVAAPKVSLNFSEQNTIVISSANVPLANLDLPPPPAPPLWLQHCSLTYYG